MLDYTTKSIQKELDIIKEKVNSVADFSTSKINEIITKYEGNTDYIEKYATLAQNYAYCAACCLLINNDLKKFKGYSYLSAKSGEMCISLYEKGMRTYMTVTNRNLENRRNVLFYVQYAILANCNDLAVRITLEDSLLGSIVRKNYEKAKKYLSKDVKEIKSKSFVDEIFWTIAYMDEQKMNQYIEKRIRALRSQAKISQAVYFDNFGLALIKLAKERGMSCSLNVIELPQHLLDDSPINEEEWKLPEDKEVEKILMS